jgi:hypothetical protein
MKKDTLRTLVFWAAILVAAAGWLVAREFTELL